jgi:hypothetical protein
MVPRQRRQGHNSEDERFAMSFLSDPDGYQVELVERHQEPD